MLTIQSSQQSRYCDGVSRRNFIQLGAMGLSGLTLSQLLQAEAQAGVRSSHKAVINIHLGGGPPHQDMWDLKPDAPVEFRGEFNPISTNVPGMHICEHMPKLAKMADKFAVIRSIVNTSGSHSNFHTHTGFDQKNLQAVGGRPALGSVVARLQGPTPDGAPPFISYNGGSAGYLGPVFKPYKPSGTDLRLTGAMTSDRLSSRASLLRGLDRLRRDMDASGKMEALDAFTQQAVGVVTSGSVADALDLKKEDPKILASYGIGGRSSSSDGKNFLLARRLVEAGVRVVTFNWGGWDTHGKNFVTLRKQLPKLDTNVSALVEDLHQRGMDKDVTVIVWGEFGRTPRINKKAGRDHWPKVMAAFLAGGGMKTGQMIGTTTRDASYAKDRPIEFQEVFATLYHNMGLNAHRDRIFDRSGTPRYPVDPGNEPMQELV